MIVALHPEGVDRNPLTGFNDGKRRRSPSTRRAWIEIAHAHFLTASYTVALHPEGVDRNFQHHLLRLRFRVALHPEGVDRNRQSSSFGRSTLRSPSTRRAWIEIPDNSII